MLLVPEFKPPNTPQGTQWQHDLRLVFKRLSLIFNIESKTLHIMAITSASRIRRVLDLGPVALCRHVSSQPKQGQVLDKLWNSHRSCLEKFALERSRGKSDFPEGRSLEGKSDYLRDLPWANVQTIPKAFPQLVRIQASKPKRMCPAGVV